MTELDTNLIHYNNIWIKGHFGASYMQSKKAFELAISPEFDASKFVTHRLPLEDITKGIELTRTEAIKVSIIPERNESGRGGIKIGQRKVLRQAVISASFSLRSALVTFV